MFKSVSFRYTLFGVLFGLLFPLAATVIEIALENRSFSFESAILVQKSQPLIWIIDTAPFFLGLLAWIAGMRKERVIKASKRLEGSKNQYMALFKQSVIGLMLIEPETGKVLMANPALCNTFGYGENEIIGTDIRSYLPQDRKEDFTSMPETLRRQGIFQIETERVKKDGTRFWVEIVVTAISSDDRKVLQASIRDISDKKALEESEKRLRHMYDNMSDLICLINPNGTYHDVSPSIKSIAGYEPGEMVGKSGYDFLHPEDLQDRGQTGNEEKMRNVGKLHTEVRFRHKNGHYIWLETIAEPILNGKAGIKYIMTSSRDITARKKAEEERDRLFNELEQKVKERTAALSSANIMLSQFNKDITDSLSYAQRLQQALLPDASILNAHFTDAFILYLPKDTVSGDFYWFHKIEDKTILVAADCTGHGVPGAFMSLVGMEKLNKIVVERAVTNPSLILELLDIELEKALSKGRKKEMKDGMDLSICRIDTEKRTVDFAGAARPALLATTNGIEQYKSSKFSLGGIIDTANKDFSTKPIPYEPGNMLYLFSDGYVDQFGGRKNKKLMIRRFREMLNEMSSFPAESQRTELHRHFLEWQGDQPQIDDVLVIGVRL